MATTSTAPPSPYRVGHLCVGADWACAHGDLAALRYVAQRLADEASEPLHGELLALADACYADPDHAVEAWTRVKDQLFGRS